MKCSLEGCPGNYESSSVTRTFTREKKSMVVEDIPALVCDICGDTIFDPEVLDELEKLTPSHSQPIRHAPVFKFPAKVG